MLETWVLVVSFCEVYLASETLTNADPGGRTPYCYAITMPTRYSSEESCRTADRRIRQEVERPISDAASFAEWRSLGDFRPAFGNCLPLLVERE